MQIDREQLAKLDPDKLERLLAKVSPEARKIVIRTIAELSTGNSDTLALIERAVWAVKPPPIDEFLYGRKFLGLPSGVLYPAIEELIYRVDDERIRTVFACAGKGSGKSSFTTITMAREAHKVGYCMRDPSAYFGVLPGTYIGILNMSVSSSQAEAVIFAKFLTLLENGRCFYRNGERNIANRTFRKRKRYIELPNNVQSISGHSGYQAYFGYDVFCGVLDEFSHFKDTTERSVAEEVFSGVEGSCKTRFPRHYKLVAISTPLSKDCPIMKRVEMARNSHVKPDLIGEDQDGGSLSVNIDGDSYAEINE